MKVQSRKSKVQSLCGGSYWRRPRLQIPDSTRFEIQRDSRFRFVDPGSRLETQGFPLCLNLECGIWNSWISNSKLETYLVPALEAAELLLELPLQPSLITAFEELPACRR